jgi:hypothetical protein
LEGRFKNSPLLRPDELQRAKGADINWPLMETVTVNNTISAVMLQAVGTLILIFVSNTVVLIQGTKLGSSKILELIADYLQNPNSLTMRFHEMQEH